MRDDLVPGNPFPDLRLPDTGGRERAFSEIANGHPLVLAFARGWWCPKEQVRLRNLVALQDELQRELGRLAAVTVDEPYVNGAFRAGLGGAFPFLSDVDRVVATELDLLELTDETHRPYLPFTFLLDSRLVISKVWCGFWYWGNPTPEELRLGLREIAAAEQPTFDPQAVWSAGARRRRARALTRRSCGSGRTRRAESCGAACTTAPCRTSAWSSAARRWTGARGSSAGSRRTAGASRST